MHTLVPSIVTTRSVVSRRATLWSLVAGGTALLISHWGRRQAAAHVATPVVTQGEMGEGIRYEQIDFGTVNVLPPAPVTINFFRAQLDPGTSIPIGTEDPGLGPQLVESGTLSARGFTQDIVIRRAGGGEETIPAGDQATLGAGDSFVWEPYVGGEIANDGDEPVVVLTVNIAPVGMAMPEARSAMATPSA